MQNPIVEPFSFDHMDNLSIAAMKEYVGKYFYRLGGKSAGAFMFIDKGNPVLLTSQQVRTTYFNYMNTEIQKWFFTKNKHIYSLVCRINKPFIEGYDINFAGKFLHKTIKPYNEYSEDTKEQVEVMLGFIREVLANNNDDMYTYLIKWFAKMCKGERNTAVLYLKGEKGIGKSTISEFIVNYVIGTELGYIGSGEPLKSKFNSILEGKLFVVFEELENATLAEWNNVASRLKNYATSTQITIEKKGVDSYSVDNTNNYIVNSNGEALKEPDGRRINCLDVSHKHMRDQQYFGAIISKCFNLEVGEAFFAYMQTVNTDGFYAQDFPKTQGKKDAVQRTLSSVYRFIKDQFILQNEDMTIHLKDVYIEYKSWALHEGYKKPVHKMDFIKKLDIVGIHNFKSTKGNKTLMYSLKHKELYAIAQKFSWIHDCDEYELPTGEVPSTAPQTEADELNNLDELAIARDRIKELEDIIAKLGNKPKQRKIKEEKKRKTKPLCDAKHAKSVPCVSFD